MIRRFFCALTAFALLFSCAGAEGFELENELLRLHVVASDDGDAAQALKLELRDVCVRAADACLEGAQDADEAWARLQEHVSDFERACRARARELGYEGAVRAELGAFEFPDRVYGKLHVPAGEYRALRVVIGAGAGRNWWCVLYPSLCMLNEADAASGTIDLRAALEWLRARFGGAA